MADLSSDSEAIATSARNPATFAVIFDRHFDAIHGYLRQRIGDDLADELASQTFLTAFDLRCRYEGSRPDARPWLFGIATNLLRNHKRHELRERRAYARAGVDSAPDALEGAEERIDASNMRARLTAALEQIPSEEAEVLLLYALAALTYAEIAQALEIPVGTVRSRLSRARARFCELLGIEEPTTRRNQEVDHG